MSKVSRYIRWAMSVAFTLAVFLFFLLKYPYHILFQEQNQLFEWTWDYFAATAAAPGGIADWTGRLLTQFFLSKAAGAAIIALLLAAVQRLCAAAMRAVSLGWYAASFLPAVVLAAYFLDEKALAGAIVAFAIVLSAAVVMSRMTPGKARTVLCIILVPVLYWICGPLAAIFALCLPKGEKWPARLAAVAALASSVAVCLPSTHHTFKALVTGVHYYRYLAGEETSTNPVATLFAWTGALRKRAELDSLAELSAFADRLERATLETIESGGMKKDLALLAEGISVKAVNTADFLAAVRARLDN